METFQANHNNLKYAAIHYIQVQESLTVIMFATLGIMLF